MIFKILYLPKADRTIPEVRKSKISLHKLYYWCRKKGEKDIKMFKNFKRQEMYGIPIPCCY